MKDIIDIKTNIQELMDEKEQIQKRLKEIDKLIMDKKLELADAVLENPQAAREQLTDDKVVMVRVEFKPGGKQYDYLWEEKERPGEYVGIQGYNGEYQRVKVIKLFRAVPRAGIKYRTAIPVDKVED